jgi:hypothetical protein
MSTLAYLLFFAIGTGLFVDLLFFAMGDPNHGEVARGRIFSRWGEYMLTRTDNRAHEIEVEHERRIVEHYERGGDEIMPIYNPVNWWKLMVCPKCFNAWATTIVFFLLFATSDMSYWWLTAIVPFQGFSNLALAIAGNTRQ